MDVSHFLIRMKHFVKSTESQSTSTALSDESTSDRKAPVFVSGTDVKQFYEKTVGEEAFETYCKNNYKQPEIIQKPKPRRPKNLIRSPFNVNLLMKEIEIGNCTDVEKILQENEARVNCLDEYGWTPLMTACCSGSRNMVQLLLQWKPDLNVRDKSGNTCRDLAAAKGHHSIIQILDQHIRTSLKPAVNAKTTSDYVSLEPLASFYCKECKQNIENTTYKKHLSSTIHNFNTSSKRKMPTFYGIPESNKGFQILVKSGWNKEDGLGPSGEGHKFPPKTILKQDRTGLGAKRYKARVTHTIEETQRTERIEKPTLRKHIKLEKIKEQKLERSIRRMLS